MEKMPAGLEGHGELLLWQQLLKGWNFLALQGSDSGSAPGGAAAMTDRCCTTELQMCTFRCAPAYPCMLQHARVKFHNDMVFYSSPGTSQGISNSTAQFGEDVL